MSLQSRFIIIALVVVFVVYPFYWAAVKSPQAQRERECASRIPAASVNGPGRAAVRARQRARARQQCDAP